MDNIETICSNSYRNFHTRGFDYLCLSRTSELTRKVYFFEGDLHNLPELVMPHDHRYRFVTTVLAGAVANNEYWKPSTRDNPDSKLFDRFDYLTPLNGGRGFEWKEEVQLIPIKGGSCTRGEYYWQSTTDIHTLDVRCEGTVILLEQLEDEIPVNQPTNSYRLVGSREPPNLDGLYDHMTPDHARMRINQFLNLIGNR